MEHFPFLSNESKNKPFVLSKLWELTSLKKILLSKWTYRQRHRRVTSLSLSKWTKIKRNIHKNIEIYCLRAKDCSIFCVIRSTKQLSLTFGFAKEFFISTITNFLSLYNHHSYCTSCKIATYGSIKNLKKIFNTNFCVLSFRWDGQLNYFVDMWFSKDFKLFYYWMQCFVEFLVIFLLMDN